MLLHHFDIRHHHAAIDCFAHIVNGQKPHAGVREIKGLAEEKIEKGLILSDCLDVIRPDLGQRKDYHKTRLIRILGEFQRE